jgi:hypothetical protein
MIEFQYFDGCPNAIETLANLNELVDAGQISGQEINIVKVNNVVLAEKLNFQGSPTILVDGFDIYTEKKPLSYAYSCRVYVFGRSQTGVISKKYISDKIKKIRQR